MANGLDGLADRDDAVLARIGSDAVGTRRAQSVEDGGEQLVHRDPPIAVAVAYAGWRVRGLGST